MGNIILKRKINLKYSHTIHYKLLFEYRCNKKPIKRNTHHFFNEDYADSDTSAKYLNCINQTEAESFSRHTNSTKK